MKLGTGMMPNLGIKPATQWWITKSSHHWFSPASQTDKERTTAPLVVLLTTSSSCIMISAPIEFWISVDFSGVSSISWPSWGDWNLTPSSVISANFNKDTIWNPPLSWKYVISWNKSCQLGKKYYYLGLRSGDLNFHSMKKKKNYLHIKNPYSQLINNARLAPPYTTTHQLQI